MKRVLLCLFLPLVCLQAASTRNKSPKTAGPVSTAKEAKAIAEHETGGRALSAQRIPLNGASGGWEVIVHMPKEERGWRCIIDCDTHMVRTKDRIPNPSKSRPSK